jgi:hypothetical protein
MRLRDAIVDHVAPAPADIATTAPGAGSYAGDAAGSAPTRPWRPDPLPKYASAVSSFRVLLVRVLLKPTGSIRF